MAAEVSATTRDILQLGLRLGIDPREYAPQLSRTWTDFIQWENGEGGETSGKSEQIDASSSIASEELMTMNEQGPGKVSELR